MPKGHRGSRGDQERNLHRNPPQSTDGLAEQLIASRSQELYQPSDDAADDDIADLQAARVDNLLTRCKIAWREGKNLAGLTEAVRLCNEFDLPLPEWAAQSMVALLELPEKERHKLLARWETFVRRTRIHYTRWSMLEELRTRKEELADLIEPTWSAAFDAVSKELRGTEAAGGRDAVETSYKLVQRLFRQKKGGRFSLV